MRPTLLLAIALFWAATPLFGQPGPASEAPPERAAGPAPGADATANETLQIPPFFFGPLKLTGAIPEGATEAELTARFEVHLTHENGWYEVPLKFPQATLLDMKHTGPREPIPVPLGDERDDGQRFLFSGRGIHQLELTLRVPIRTTASGASLVLTLPGLRQFPAQANLEIGGLAIAVTGGTENAIRQVQQVGTAARVDVEVRGSRLDITWRSAPERPGVVSRVVSSMTLSRSGDSLQLHLRQDLTADGRVTELIARLPTGFELSGPSGITGPGYASHEMLEDEPGWVRIAVNADERSDIQLEWLLVAPFPDDGGAVLVDGFEIRGALREIGTVGVAPIPGYRVLRHLSDDSQSVQRISTHGVRSSVAFLTTAFQFVEQPLQLLLEFQKQRASTTVRPRWLVTVGDSHLEMLVDLDVMVNSGVVTEMMLDWPVSHEAGWTAVALVPGMRVEEALDAPEAQASLRQRIVFEEAREGEFRFALKFRCQRPADTIELPLPKPVSDRLLPGWLAIRDFDAYELILDDPSSHGLTPVEDSNAQQWIASISASEPLEKAFEVDRETETVPGHFVAHERMVTAETAVTVKLDADRMQVRQNVDIDVRYGRFQSLPLKVPSSFPAIPAGAERAAIQATLNNTLLDVRRTSGTLEVVLPSPQRGPFRISLAYSLPRPDDTGVAVPILGLDEIPFRSTSMEVQTDTPVQVRAKDPAWQVVPTNPDVWFTTQPVGEFIATLGRRVASAPQSYEVENVLFQITDLSQETVITADYQLQRRPDLLLVGLPRASQLDSVFWNGRRLQVPVPQKVDATNRFSLRLPDEIGESGWLRLQYVHPRSTRWTPLAANDVLLPELPESVAVKRVFVELSLPPGSHLLTYPPGMVPLFKWEPGLIWQRRVTADYTEARPGLLSPTPADSVDHETLLNRYAFRSVSQPAMVRYRATGMWMLILIGSGTTLGLSFLLWSVPAARNFLTVLVVGFIISLAGVFAAESVEVLLQPALLGLIAAAVVMLAHSRSRTSMSRRRYERGREFDLSASPHGYGSSQAIPMRMQESGSHQR